MKLTFAALSLVVPLVTCGVEGPPVPPPPLPPMPAEAAPETGVAPDAAPMVGEAAMAPAVGAPSP